MYPSNSYLDDLVMAAGWLAKRKMLIKCVQNAYMMIT